VSAEAALPLPPGEPTELEAVARRFTGAARELDRAAGQVRGERGAVAANWRGPASDAAGLSLGQLAEHTAAHPPALVAGAGALSSYAAALRAARHEVGRLQAEWEQLDADANRRAALAPAGSPAATAQLAEIDQARAALRARHAGVLADLAAAGQRTGAALRAAADGLPDSAVIAAIAGHPVPDGGVDSSAEPLTPQPGTDPRQVAQWWASLTPEQRAWLKQHRYHELRDLRGLPAVDLDEINRRRLADDRTSLRQRAAALAASLKEKGLLSDPAMLAEYQRVARALANADRVQRALDENSGTLLITYDPYGPTGAGRAAIAYGNPDTADNTALVVPGTGNSPRDLSGPMDNERLLRAKMGQLSPPKGDNAVIVWMGYDAPDTLPAAAHDHYAEDGQGWLKDDVAGYQVAHEQATGRHGHTTVVSHSYGTYVTGLALHDSMKVDDVVFVGSPGVGVNHASDLGMDGRHVYVGRTHDDPIPIADDRFTPHPPFGNGPEDDGFGATTFGTDDSHGHSEYYKEPSESLTNLGRIAVGQGNQITLPDPPPPVYRPIPGPAGPPTVPTQAPPEPVPTAPTPAGPR
jgi:uncharacterized protein YukE